METDPRLHFVVATAIIVKKDTKGKRKYLIAKRAFHEKAFPNRWTVPGGKLVLHEYKDLPKTNEDAWYNIANWLLKKEIREEVGIETDKPQYLTDLVFVRPDGYPVFTISFWCKYKSGKVNLCKDLSDYAWVTAKDVKNYDLISGIDEEIKSVERILRRNHK